MLHSPKRLESKERKYTAVVLVLRLSYTRISRSRVDNAPNSPALPAAWLPLQGIGHPTCSCRVTGASGCCHGRRPDPVSLTRERSQFNIQRTAATGGYDFHTFVKSTSPKPRPCVWGLCALPCTEERHSNNVRAPDCTSQPKDTVGCADHCHTLQTAHQ